MLAAWVIWCYDDSTVTEALSNINMSSTVTFISWRTSGSRNFIHDGYRYCLDKKRDDKTYWRCTDKTCPGRLNLMNDTTVTSMEPHSHPLTPAANSIHTAKLKASDTDLPMKHLIATLLDHSLSKPYQVNCQSRHHSLRLHAMLGPPGGFRTRVRLISVFLAVL